jgi:WD40 repeat protein
VFRRFARGPCGLATGREEATLTGHGGWVSAVAVTSDGKTAVIGGDDWTVRVRDLATGRERVALTGHGDHVRAVAVTPDERTELPSRHGPLT